MKLNRLCLFSSETVRTEIYTLSLHDALPIFRRTLCNRCNVYTVFTKCREHPATSAGMMLHVLPYYCNKDRKSTRLNSSHSQNSYAVFCVKKKLIILHDSTLLVEFNRGTPTSR